MDFNGNEIIEASEIDTFLQMFNNGRGFDSPNNDGETAEPEKSDERGKSSDADNR